MRSMLWAIATVAALGGFFVTGATPVRADDKPAAEEGPPAAIYKHWIHSREEDKDGVKVYRPEGFKFPPSRGRTGFEIKKNGEFVAHDIGAADGIDKVPGKWKLEGKKKLVVTFPGTKREGMTFEIVSCDDKVLKVK